jgi:hypothetical protein
LVIVPPAPSSSASMLVLPSVRCPRPDRGDPPRAGRGGAGPGADRPSPGTARARPAGHVIPPPVPSGYPMPTPRTPKDCTQCRSKMLSFPAPYLLNYCAMNCCRAARQVASSVQHGRPGGRNHGSFCGQNVYGAVEHFSFSMAGCGEGATHGPPCNNVQLCTDWCSSVTKWSRRCYLSCYLDPVSNLL